MAYNSQFTGAQIDEAVADVRSNKDAWNGKQNKITASGILKGDGAGGVSAAVPGTDYLGTFSVVFTGRPNAYTCNRTAAEIYDAWSASLKPGGKQLVGYSDMSGVMTNVYMWYDDGPTKFWLQFMNMSYDNNDFAGKVPVFYYVDVRIERGKTSFVGSSLYAQPRIYLESKGAIPKVENSLGPADMFVAAVPDTDYMTPSMGASGAKVGQTLNVQAVDDSGKPTKWETRDALPVVASSDNGKFLRVVNGAWAAVEIANANGGSF